MSEKLSRRSFVKFAGVAAVTLGLAACSSKPGSSTTEDGKLGGTLTMYTPNSETLVKNVIPAFEKQTGVKVELVQAGTGEVFKKIESEASRPIADVVWGGSYTVFLSHMNNFQKYVSKANDQVLPLYRNKTGYYTPYGLDGSVILVNKKLTDGISIKGYKDLLNPKLAGQILSANPTNSSSAFAQLTNMLADMGGYDNDAAWNYVKELFTKQIGKKVLARSSLVYKKVADGENAVGLSYEDPCIELLRDGKKDLEVVYPVEGAVYLPASSAIIKDCANLKQAQAWIDFLVSKEAQTIIAEKTTERPIRDDVKLSSYMKPFKDIKLREENYEYVYKHKEEILKRYTEIARMV